MKWHGRMMTLLIACSLAPLAIAQSGMNVRATEQYVPRLDDLMTAIQLRHMKLWFAGKAFNWELAAYELRQLDTGLMEAATPYPDIPVSDVTTMAKPAKSISDAIEARDGRRFAKAVGELTDGCNACHQSVGRGFIVMRTPTEQPFSNQVFPPQAKQ
jgi:hypothetical protein